jgi:hypothetical protein
MLRRNTVGFAGAALGALFALSLARPKKPSLSRIRVRGQSSRAAISNLAPIDSEPCERKMSRRKNRVRSIDCTGSSKRTVRCC